MQQSCAEGGPVRLLAGKHRGRSPPAAPQPEHGFPTQEAFLEPSEWFLPHLPQPHGKGEAAAHTGGTSRGKVLLKELTAPLVHLALGAGGPAAASPRLLLPSVHEAILGDAGCAQEFLPQAKPGASGALRVCTVTGVLSTSQGLPSSKRFPLLLPSSFHRVIL